ncbi:helix-turn-helix domain-containing protein [Massilia agilis]|uniref:Helix-turn-helix domain-containing protein n=1 Tax=Massilia agilis TaxID=1811226 RepID=A0ABT2DCB4_9BURK|nr:helix-turn-helix domain-containing protein [Massilia agilis]MCS0808962.1 helix-turn-helix domain-containing protein [Massilia agilis]
MKNTSNTAPQRVAIAAFAGISPFHLSVPCLVFGEDRREDGIPRPDVLVCADTPGMLPTTAGFSIAVAHGLERLADAHTVIVPSWRDPLEPAPPALLEALRAAHARGATVVGLCLGAFVLAQAGLLDGRRATTHWRWARAFAEAFPKVALDPGVLYVEDGNLVTSAGTAASLDCCLHLLRAQVGPELANRVARRLVVSPHRQGGQAQFIEQPLPRAARGDRLGEAMEWAIGHLDDAPGIDQLAQRAAMSRRTFTRRFRERTGTSYNAWINGQRIALAQRLLETTDLAIEQVAQQAGFGSALSLRLRFAESLDTTPSAYRREFRGA